MAAAVHHIQDDWEEVPDDDTFSMVSAPGSEPDAVLISAAQTAPVSASSPLGQQHLSTQSSFWEAPSSSSPPSPSAPIGIPQCAALFVADIHPRSSQDLASSSVAPTAAAGDTAAATITDLPPPYEDLDREAPVAAAAAPSDLDGQRNSRSVSPGWPDDAVAATGTSTNPSELLCQLAMAESARSEVVRFATDELAPVRARLGQQVLDVCARLGAQVADLQAVLSSYERAWDASSSAAYAASICVDPALEEWLQSVRQLLVALQSEAESVALQSLDMDSDSRHKVTDCSIEEFLQSLCAYLVNHSQKMDDFLPIMLSEFISEQTAIFP